VEVDTLVEKPKNICQCLKAIQEKNSSNNFVTRKQMRTEEILKLKIEKEVSEDLGLIYNANSNEDVKNI